jgi:hypothetical protein
VFDYGLRWLHYCHAQRLTGTLRCHFRHRVHVILTPTGLQDITACGLHAPRQAATRRDHVGRFRHAGGSCSPRTETFVAEAGDAARARPAGRRAVSSRPRRCEAFKVLAPTRQHDAAGGFALQDLRQLL